MFQSLNPPSAGRSPFAAQPCPAEPPPERHHKRRARCWAAKRTEGEGSAGIVALQVMPLSGLPVPCQVPISPNRCPAAKRMAVHRDSSASVAAGQPGDAAWQQYTPATAAASAARMLTTIETAFWRRLCSTSNPSKAKTDGHGRGLRRRAGRDGPGRGKKRGEKNGPGRGPMGTHRTLNGLALPPALARPGGVAATAQHTRGPEGRAPRLTDPQ